MSPEARITTDADNDTKLAATAAEEREYVQARGGGEAVATTVGGLVVGWRVLCGGCIVLESLGDCVVFGWVHIHSYTAHPNDTATSHAPLNIPTQFHFVCECFFMTAKALRLGVIKTMQQTESEAQLIGRLRVFVCVCGGGILYVVCHAWVCVWVGWYNMVLCMFIFSIYDLFAPYVMLNNGNNIAYRLHRTSLPHYSPHAPFSYIEHTLITHPHHTPSLHTLITHLHYTASSHTLTHLPHTASSQ